ncbi:MAG: MATE family efflux transporter [Granulosicoccus sp.]
MNVAGVRLTTLKAELLRTLRMGLPLMGAQILQVGNGLIDALIAGRLGSSELAAGGIGASLWFFTSLLCIGLMAGLSPTLSRLIGERRRVFVGHVFRQGVWLALLTGLLALSIVMAIQQTVHLFPFTPELPPLISEYLMGAAWSLPFFALVMAARNVCEATGLTRPVLLVTAMGLVINALASAVLGLGLVGFPALGLLGIGIATSIVNLSTALVLFTLLRGERFKRYALFATLERPDWTVLGPMLTLSIPICLGMIFEAGLFVATSVQMGMIGVVEAGAHQIAISASAFCYMLPLGMSFALTARIGRAEGQRSMMSIRLRIVSGCLLVMVMACLTAIMLIFFRYQIASAYTSDPVMLKFAASLLLLGAVFQLSDGAQIMLIGMLRGLHDTRVPMLINAFSYWIIAFGSGLFTAHVLDFGAYGLWFGLIVGLSVASVLLGYRLKWKLRSMQHSGFQKA